MAHLSYRKYVPYNNNNNNNDNNNNDNNNILNKLVDLCAFNVIYRYVCVFKTFMNMERR